MADQRGVVNSDYMADELFPGIANPGGTGAPGSAGIAANTDVGPALGTVGMRVPDGGMRDVAAPVTVYAGDTSGMADDIPAHESVIMPGPQEAYMASGPFPESHVVSAPRYPWQAPDGAR